MSHVIKIHYSFYIGYLSLAFNALDIKWFLTCAEDVINVLNGKYSLPKNILPSEKIQVSVFIM